MWGGRREGGRDGREGELERIVGSTCLIERIGGGAEENADAACVVRGCVER